MAVVGAPHTSKNGHERRSRRTCWRTTASDCASQLLAASIFRKFDRGKRELKVRVEGQLVFNAIAMILVAESARKSVLSLCDSEYFLFGW